jgi:hypothetical protein
MVRTSKQQNEEWGNQQDAYGIGQRPTDPHRSAVVHVYLAAKIDSQDANGRTDAGGANASEENKQEDASSRVESFSYWNRFVEEIGPAKAAQSASNGPNDGAHFADTRELREKRSDQDRRPHPESEQCKHRYSDACGNPDGGDERVGQCQVVLNLPDQQVDQNDASGTDQISNRQYSDALRQHGRL